MPARGEPDPVVVNGRELAGKLGYDVVVPAVCARGGVLLICGEDGAAVHR